MATVDPMIIDRYAIFDEIAAGGMATVHIGRLVGPVGFSRTVAIKRLHPQFARDPDFVSMFVDEARLAARIRHPNVVPTLDVVQTETEIFLVMEYITGESLSRLLRRARRQGRVLDIRIVLPVVTAMLHGLHAAHTARGERGEALHIVHRDVSPQNVLVGSDGVTRVFDFGVAKARGRLQTTRDGQIKGKLAYMAPEQLGGEEVTAATDVYAAGCVLWECLAGRRVFDADTEAALVTQVVTGVTHPPSEFNEAVSPELDEVVLKALAHRVEDRYGSARDMAVALERLDEKVASATEIGEWVEAFAADSLGTRADRIAEIESRSEVKSLGERISRPVSLSNPELDAASSSTETPAASARTAADLSLDGAENSQLSSISVTGTPLPREPNRRRWAVAALALLLGGGVAAATLGRGESASKPSALPSATSGPVAGDTTTPAPSSAQASASASARAEPSDGVGGASGDDPSQGRPPGEPPSATPPKTQSGLQAQPKSQPKSQPAPRPAPVRPPPVRPPSPPPPAPKANCTPPYYFDADGIKRYKPQCL